MYDMNIHTEKLKLLNHLKRNQLSISNGTKENNTSALHQTHRQNDRKQTMSVELRYKIDIYLQFCTIDQDLLQIS